VITISVPSDLGHSHETLEFDTIPEAEAYLDHLELRDDDGHSSFELMAAILHLREAIAEAKEAQS